jgi:hypothetical protein
MVHHDDLLWHDIDDGITTTTTLSDDEEDDDDDDEEVLQVDDDDDDDDDDDGSGLANDDGGGDDDAAGATPRLTRSRNPDVTTADWREVYGAHDAGKRNKTIRVVTCSSNILIAGVATRR